MLVYRRVLSNLKKAFYFQFDGFCIPGKYGIPLNIKNIITSARLISIKGIDLFLQQIKENAYVTESAFILVSEGPVKLKIKEIAERYKLDVRLMGYCNQDTIREFYALADCFLLPSLSVQNPLTSIEASFSGLPLLVRGT